MVDSKNVIFFFAGGKALYPPGIAVFFLFFPVINGVSPKLAVGAERIRRAAGNTFRVKVFVKKELFRFRPDVRGIQRNIDRNIADDFYSFSVCVGTEFFPLGEKFKLEKIAESYLFRKFFAFFRKGFFVS